jgi:hypothetical protein
MSYFSHSYAAGEYNCPAGPGVCPSPPASCPPFYHFHGLDPVHCLLVALLGQLMAGYAMMWVGRRECSAMHSRDNLVVPCTTWLSRVKTWYGKMSARY